LILFFFFSSRRRHTRFSRDWSSDVCSSDLSDPGTTLQALYSAIDARFDGPLFSSSAMRRQEWGRRFGAALDRRGVDSEREFDPRSEERRVGKECRSRGGTCATTTKRKKRMR